MSRFWKEGREISEAELIAKAKDGDERAFRLLVVKYQNDVFRVVYSVLRDEKEAEDAAQEVFLKVYYSLSQFENKGFKTWLTRIAVNHAIDIRRKKMRQPEDVVESFEFGVMTVAEQSVEKQVLSKEKRDLVQKRIAELPENYREVIYGFYIEEKSYQQMADEQNVQLKTIETKLYRARRWMREHWKEDDFR